MQAISALIFALALLVSSMAQAVGPVIGANCVIAWNPVTTNADTTPITDLMEYRLYVSATSGTQNLNSPQGASIAAPTVELRCAQQGIHAPGQYYAVVTAVDTGGLQSLASGELAFVYAPVSLDHYYDDVAASIPLITLTAPPSAGVRSGGVTVGGMGK